ncbi:hypothetical protein PilKf_00232 [Pillotina sp. SPG140]
MKIGVKLVSLISIFNIIGISILAGVTVTLAHREISRLAEEQAYSLAQKGAEEMKNWFATYVDTARTLADIMEGYTEIPAEERREQFNFMLKQTLIAHPEVTLVYTNWAQNALDGMDTDFANTPGTDETGRYATNWSASNGHDVRMWPIDGFPFDLVMQATSGQEFVFEPSEHFVGDKNWLVTNLCIPIKDNNQMVGSTGIVFELSTIQTIADTIKPLGNGSTMVFSSSGIVAAHPDPDRLGKNMRESESYTFGESLDTLVDAVTTGKSVAFSAPAVNGGGGGGLFSTMPFLLLSVNLRNHGRSLSVSPEIRLWLPCTVCSISVLLLVFSPFCLYPAELFLLSLRPSAAP